MSGTGNRKETYQAAHKSESVLPRKSSQDATISMLEKSRIASLNLLEDLKEEIVTRRETEERLRLSEERYRSLFETMQEGFALHEIICDKRGRAVDYRFLNINPSFERLTGLKADKILGKTIMEVLPDTEKGWIERYGQVALTMKEIEFEDYASEIGRYYRVRAFSPEKGKFATLFEDITDKWVMEDNLRRNEEKFRTIFQSLGTGILYMTRKGKIIDVNPAFVNITGLKRDQLVGKNIVNLARHLLPGSTAREVLKTLGKTMKGLPVTDYPFEFNNRKLNGSAFFSPEMDMTIVTITDITLLEKAEKEKLDLLIRQNAILGAVPDIIMEVDTEKYYTWANQAGLDFFGKDVIGKPASFYFEGEQETYEIVDPLFKGEDEPIYVESWQRRSDGEIRLLAWWCKTLKDSDGNVSGGLSSARDITQIKRTEIELESSLDQLKQLNQYLQRIREEERKMIARDLHDVLGQELTAIKIDLGAIVQKEEATTEIRNKIYKISSMLSDSILTVKRITSELRPHILDDLGLTSAIDWYTKSYSARTGIMVTVEIDDSISLPAESELVIFRIIQESLTNIARHSQAKHTRISFVMKPSDMVLNINDDGIGIPQSRLKAKGSFGLINMRERAQEIGGTLTITTGPKSGTTIKVSIPRSLNVMSK